MAVGGGMRIFLSAAVFVITGLVQTVCIQSVLYSGGGDRSTFLLALPNYLGIVSVYFIGARCFKLLDRFGVWSSGGADINRVHLSLYEKRQDSGLSFFQRLFHRDRRKLFVLAFNEMGGFLAGLTGISIAGSGLYQVVFSGATVFTALLTTFFLPKRLTFLQWFFVAVITSGLMITAEQVTHGSDDARAASLISGISFVLVSCLFYSTNYVIAEHFLDREHNEDPSLSVDDESEIPVLPPPSGLDLSLYTGGSCLIIFSIYVTLHTIPNWRELVTSSIKRHHGDTTLIMEEYIYLTIASFFHAISHYDVVATVGAVPIGVLNAIRAVSVFAASSFLFCANQASQCYNSRKGISTAIVIIGAFGYSAASAAAKGKSEVTPTYNKVSRAEARAARKMRRALSMSISADLSKNMSFSFLDGYETSTEKKSATQKSWFNFLKNIRAHTTSPEG